jgi:hypothetical protein
VAEKDYGNDHGRQPHEREEHYRFVGLVESYFLKRRRKCENRRCNNVDQQQKRSDVPNDK